MNVWPAPAKLNLFLHVVGRRSDGYHELQTLFQLLDYSDSLRFSLRTDGVITRRGGTGLPADDLTVRAARTLQVFAGVRAGVMNRNMPDKFQNINGCSPKLCKSDFYD